MAEVISKVALYARVSTTNGQDPELQLSELREHAGRRGWTVVHEYIDHGISGSKESRPALNQLMSDARHHRFDAVCVWKLDRFGRSLKHLVNSLADLEAMGVAFISLRDNLDLSTASGRLMFHLLGAMAQFERSLIQERVKAGMRNARAKGRKLGRPRVYVNTREVERLRQQGLGWKRVAAALRLGVGTVVRAMEREHPFQNGHLSDALQTIEGNGFENSNADVEVGTQEGTKI